MDTIIPLRIWQVILEYTDFPTQIRLRQVNKRFYRLSIIDFHNISYYHMDKLTDSIISQHLNIRYLCAYYNPKITNVNHLKHLIKLDAQGESCGLTDIGLKDCIELQILYTGDNPKITTVNHFKSLRVLGVSSNSGITNEGFKDCINITRLIVHENPKITNISHLIKLTDLITYDYGLKQQFQEIKLKYNHSTS